MLYNKYTCHSSVLVVLWLQSLITTPSCKPCSFCLPISFTVEFWVPTGGWLPSRHDTRVPLRSSVAATVAVDLMNISDIDTANWNRSSEGIWSYRVRVREILRDGTLHSCVGEGIVHVNVTFWPGQALSTLDCNCVLETEPVFDLNV